MEDLSRRFGEDFRIIGASPAAGLAMLRELAGEHVRVAVLIVQKIREVPRNIELYN